MMLSKLKQPLLWWLLFPISFSSIKITEDISNEIVSFTLFSYDNLIADAYETDKPYINRLSIMLSNATNKAETTFYEILNSNDLSSETIPIKYLILLNKKTIEATNYTFLNE